MREVEIKAHAKSWQEIKRRIDTIAGIGNPVDKKDTYLLNDAGKRMRVRDNNGSFEATVKSTHKDSKGDEDNMEYEVHFSKESSYDDLIAFFKALGYPKFYFNKYKKGYDWSYEGVHIELLEVNDLGWFLEMEALMPFDSKSESIEKEMIHLHALLRTFGLDDSDIETKSYRKMILG